MKQEQDKKKTESVKKITADKTKVALVVKSAVKAGPGVIVGRPIG